MADPFYGLTGIPNPTSAAGQGLGDLLGQQRVDETDEQRRKRLQEAGLPEAQSAAAKSLFNTFSPSGPASGLGVRGKGF